MATKRPTTFSMRMPEDLNQKILEYATSHNCTKAEAMSHFARAGIELEENGLHQSPVETDTPAEESASQQTPLHERAQKDAFAREALQLLPRIQPDVTTLVLPSDIQGKIQAYSVAHECSEHEALTYYARIGIQVSEGPRPASAEDVAELITRMDLLAASDAQKSEKLREMGELLEHIREYTKPDELELEGELADQEAEDVPALTEEERQALADEHTRKIVSDVMDDFLERQQEEMDQREADAARRSGINNIAVIWIPVLVAIIASLVMGIIIMNLR